MNLHTFFPHLHRHFAQGLMAAASDTPCSLAQAQVGALVEIHGVDRLPQSQRQHLQAYGIVPGRNVRVLSKHPLIIVQVEQTELAFETEVGRQILITARA
jgi:Fe2+ transport system protein FeoA